MGTATMTATDTEREDAASALFKGLGYLFSRKHASSEPEYQRAIAIVTGIDASDDDQYDLLTKALASLPIGDMRTATENALGGYSPYQGQSLADRRRSIAEQFDVSPRTVFRYEARGIHDVIKHIDRLLERKGYYSDITEDDENAVNFVTSRSSELMKEIEKIQSSPNGPETIARVRTALDKFLEDVALYEYEDTAPETVRTLIKRYRDWREDIDELYWNLRMRND